MNGDRVALAILASVGALETGAISYGKLSGNDSFEALCLTGGSCTDVLNGPWSEIFGIPLAAIGFAAYVSIVGLASWSAFHSQPSSNSKPAESALLGLGAAMATVSAYLMFLLAFVIQACVSI